MKFLIPTLLLALGVSLSAQNGSGEFRTVNRFYSDELGTRLTIRPEARPGSYADSLELRIEDETFFDSTISEFKKREVATINGGGLSNFGLRFYTKQLRFQEEMIQLLGEFQAKVHAFNRNRPEFQNLDEKWMAQGASSLSESRVLTEIQTDFMTRPSVVTLNWDMETNRLWLSLDDFINIESSIAEPLARLIERIPEYSRERVRYQQEIKRKNAWIDEALDLPENAESEPTADTTDTPTVISEELEEIKDGEKVDLPPTE